MRRVAISFAVCAALILVGVGVALTRSAPRALGSGAGGESPLALTHYDVTVCQSKETMPAGVSAVRIWMWAYFGSPIRVTAYQGPRILTTGSRDAAWTSRTVTVPVRRTARAASNVKLCFAIEPNSEPLILLGAETHRDGAKVVRTNAPEWTRKAREGLSLTGRVRIEYLGSGERSWWSRALAVARHFGLGRAIDGTWIAGFAAVLMLAVAGVAGGLTLREAR